MGLWPIFSVRGLANRKLSQTTKNPIAGLRSYQNSVAGADSAKFGQMHHLAGARVYGNWQGFCNIRVAASRSLEKLCTALPDTLRWKPEIADISRCRPNRRLNSCDRHADCDCYATGLTINVCNAMPTLPHLSKSIAWECPIPLGCQNEVACEAIQSDCGNR